MNQALEKILRPYGLRGSIAGAVRVFGEPSEFVAEGLETKRVTERFLHYTPFELAKRFRRFRTPTYYNIRPYMTLSGPGLRPLLVDELGRTVIGVIKNGDQSEIVCGFDLLSEVLLFKQGDPDQTTANVQKCAYGFPFERPLYLFSHHLHPRFPTIPWADNVCFFLLKALSEIKSVEVAPVLPDGLKGLIILTGDDDQAWVEKYWEQQNLLKGLPITYFLVEKTKLNSETISMFGPHVDWGLHPDSLDEPKSYASIFRRETSYLNQLVGRKLQTVRNHGFLNDGYWGHLTTWEEAGVSLSSNIPGMDGTCYTGSFLPSKICNADGRWSEHYSILTAFGDGMMPVLGISQRAAIAKIRKLVRQIETTHPGALVFNFHPQNVTETRKVHKYLVRQSRRPGWRAMNLSQYLDWLRSVE